MKKEVCFFLFLFIFISISVFAQKEIIPVLVDGDEVSYLQEQGIVEAKGNVKLTYKDVVILCEKAIYNAKENTAELEGNVRIQSEKGLVNGEKVTYNFNTRYAEVSPVRVSASPYYGKAEGSSEIYEDKYILNNSYITTCDLDNPHYRISAKQILVYPQDRVVAKNIFIKIGYLPVFYFPYFSQSLEDRSFPFEIYPGKHADWGFYTLTRWRYHLDKDNRGKISFDWYEDRGMGEGLIHKFSLDNFGDGLLRLYYIDDDLYSTDKREELWERYPERQSISEKYLDNNRYKIQLFHNWQPQENLSIISELHKFSDEYMVKDFFYREYEVEPHPLTYNIIDYNWERASLSLLTQKRMNAFFSETEYLPQLEYNIFSQPLFNSYLYFQSQNTLGYLTRQYAYSHDEEESMRFHTHNVIELHQNIGFVNIKPYIGSYTTFYSRNRWEDRNNIRQAFEGGVSFSTKFYRTFDTQLNLLGEDIDKIRHILTPTIDYIYINEPTISKDNLITFDTIDELERAEKIVFSLKNKIQTKNKEKIRDFIYFSPSLEYRINQEGKGSYFDSLVGDWEFYPTDNFSWTADAKYDFVDRAFKEINTDLSFHDSLREKYEFSFGHRYTRDNSSQSTFAFNYNINPKLQFRNYLNYEYKGGRFKKEFVLRRDMHCWWMDIGLDISEDKEYTIWLVFKLKEFPDVNVGFEQSYSGAKKGY